MNVFRNMLYMARRFKTATVLNFIGLTMSLAAFYLLMTQVVYNRSYNASIPDGERVFRLESKMNPDAQWGINSSRPTNALLAKLPQVEAVSGCWLRRTASRLSHPPVYPCRLPMRPAPTRLPPEAA